MRNIRFSEIKKETLEQWLENNFIEIDNLSDFLVGQTAKYKLINDELGGKILKIEVRLKEL